MWRHCLHTRTSEEIVLGRVYWLEKKKEKKLLEERCRYDSPILINEYDENDSVTYRISSVEINKQNCAGPLVKRCEVAQCLLTHCISMYLCSLIRSFSNIASSSVIVCPCSNVSIVRPKHKLCTQHRSVPPHNRKPSVREKAEQNPRRNHWPQVAGWPRNKLAAPRWTEHETRNSPANGRSFAPKAPRISWHSAAPPLACCCRSEDRQEDL